MHGPLSHVGIIALVPDYWDVPWQPRHHVMSRLSKYFTVVWVESPHVWGGSCRAPSSASAIRPTHEGGPWVYRSQLPLPRPLRTPRLTELVHRSRVRKAHRWLKARGCTRIVLYIWRPQFGDALDALDCDLSVYHMDDEYSFSDIDTPVSESESEIIARSDRVIVHSRALYEKKGWINPQTMVVPNGVDFHAYSTPRPEPRDIASVPRPRVGYSGYVKRQLDWELLDTLTTRHPEWSFVFAGATQLGLNLSETLDRVTRRRNVFYLGPKTVDELASYPQHFDCCIMPYRNNAYTKYIYPMKLHEYLASGQPVVGRRINSLRDYERVIRLADDADEWSAAIRSCFSEEGNAAERRLERQLVAADHDWDMLTLQLARVITEGLGEASVTDNGAWAAHAIQSVACQSHQSG